MLLLVVLCLTDLGLGDSHLVIPFLCSLVPLLFSFFFFVHFAFFVLFLHKVALSIQFLFKKKKEMKRIVALG